MFPALSPGDACFDSPEHAAVSTKTKASDLMDVISVITDDTSRYETPRGHWSGPSLPGRRRSDGVVREQAGLAQREEHVVAVAQAERSAAFPVEIGAQPGADRRDVELDLKAARQRRDAHDARRQCTVGRRPRQNDVMGTDVEPPTGIAVV